MWYIPMILRVVIANGLGSFVVKKITNQPSRTKRFVLQSLFCAVFALIFVVLIGDLKNLSDKFGFLIAVGIANALGSFCYWQAASISLSKASLFSFSADIISVLLAFFILGETRFLNSTLLLGIIICFGAIILFAFWASKKTTSTPSTGKVYILYFYIGVYSIIWGVIGFLEKYFALSGVPTSQFLFGWYGGSFAGALLILAFSYLRNQVTKRQDQSVGLRGVMEVFLLSCITIISLGLSYWVMILAPLVVVQPIFFISGIIVPFIVGLTFFKESQKLTKGEWLCFALGILGVILVAVGYGAGK